MKSVYRSRWGLAGSCIILGLCVGLIGVRTAKAVIVAQGAAGAYGTNPDSLNQREDKTLAQVFTQAHGKYTEASSRGVMFRACDQAGTALSVSLTTTVTFTLYNPQGSGKRIVVCKASAGYISGTLGAGTVFHCVNNSTTQTAPSSGTLLTTYCCDAGLSSAAVGVCRTGATVVAAVAHRPFFSTGAALATTALGMYAVTDDLDGEIILEPGTSYQICGVCAAGSSPVIACGVSWEEYPLI